MATFGDKILISGFGNSDVNGSYDYVGEYNSYPLYQKGNFYIFYSSTYMPWSNAEGYYIAEKKQIQGSIPILKPIYRISGTSSEGTVSWHSLLDVTSGENTVGTTVYDEGSSSSSSS